MYRSQSMPPRSTVPGTSRHHVPAAAAGGGRWLLYSLGLGLATSLTVSFAALSHLPHNNAAMRHPLQQHEGISREAPFASSADRPRKTRRWIDESSKFNTSSEVRRYRRSVVLEQIRHSYGGYESFAYGADELDPVSCRGVNWRDAGGWRRSATRNTTTGDGGGLALTLVDSLSTLLVADETAAFERALQYIIDGRLRFDVDQSVSVFEMTIRVVGGLLSAYELSGERHRVLLDKARDMADRLLPAFDTTSGIPHSHVHLSLGNHSNPRSWHRTASLAEMGTLGLEFRTLSYHTRDPRYAVASNRVSAAIESLCPRLLCPVEFDNNAQTPPSQQRFVGGHLSVGSFGDSYYEYLLKQYVHSGLEDLPHLGRFLKAALQVIDALVTAETAPPKGTSTGAQEPLLASVPRAFVSERHDGNLQPVRRMEVLTCFFGGALKYAARVVPFHGAASSVVDMALHQSQLAAGATTKDAIHAQFTAAGKGITAMCAASRYLSPLGLYPEVWELPHVDAPIRAAAVRQGAAVPYLLRPEPLEALMYHAIFDVEKKPPVDSGATTDDSPAVSAWEEALWGGFVEVIRKCRTRCGFSGVRDVLGDSPEFDGEMPSYFLSETVKYPLLAFSVDPVFDNLAGSVARGLASDWVLNTEGHPLRIRHDLLDRIPAF